MDKQYPVRQWAHGADLVVSQLEAQGYAGVRHPRRQNRQGLRFTAGFLHSHYSGTPRSQRRIYGRRRRTYYRQSGRGAGHLRSGCSNLITGMATANSEGDPVVARAAR